MITPGNYKDYDKDYYYEFDIMYFLKNNRLVGYYVKHEDIIGFINNKPNIEILYSLDKSVTKYIFESTEIFKKFNHQQLTQPIKNTSYVQFQTESVLESPQTISRREIIC